MSMQKMLIRYVLEPFACFMDRFQPKTKDRVFVISCLLIIFQYFLKGAGLVQYRYLIFYGIDCMLLGLMILCSLKPGIQPLKFRKTLAVSWFGVGLLMLQSGLRNNVDYLPEAVLFLIAYPVAFLVWNNNDVGKIMKLLVQSMKLSFLVFLVMSFLFYPMEEIRYSGLFTNVNGASGYLALVFTCLIVEVISERKVTARHVGNLVLTGVCTALLFYTNSRTGELEILVAAVAACGMYWIAHRKEGKKYFYRNVALICFSILIFFNVTIYVFQSNKVLGAVMGEIQSSIQAVSTQATDDGEWLAESTETEPEGNRTGQTILKPSDSKEVNDQRTSADGKTALEISTGRTAIWVGYLQQLNLFGHADSGTVVIQYGGAERVYHTTHMTILQIAYESGAIAGILYLLFNITAGVCSIVYVVRSRDDPYAMLPLLIAVAYGVHSLLASTGTSFWYMSAFYYYLVQFPVIAHIPDRVDGS